MARSNRPGVRAQAGIAAQVGERLARHNADALIGAAPHSARSAPQFRLAENFQVWTLGNSALSALHHGLQGLSPEQRLIEFAENTRRVHHQIRGSRGRAIGYARSIPGVGSEPTDEWKVQSVNISALASAIDKTIRWIDRKGLATQCPTAADKHRVRLLALPQYHVTAFWLECARTDHIVVIDMPMGMSEMRLRHPYKWYEFFEALSQTKPVGAPAADASTMSRPPPALPRNAPRATPNSS